MAVLRFIAAACLLGACSPAWADHAREPALKAAFAYNFLVLSTWARAPGPVLRFCVAGPQVPDAFKVLHGKGVGERTVEVVQVESPERVAGCQALFIPATQEARLKAWLAAAAGRPILTITEQPGASRQGSIANLRVVEDRVVFDLDLPAAASAGIALSSQLIKLAQVRHGP